MGYLKRSISIALVIILMMSVTVIPASAVTIQDIDWYWHFTDKESGFPELYNGSGESGYIKLVQRFLFVCPNTHYTIYNANSSYQGIDGGFGNDTEAAVELFQKLVLGEDEADGYVGPQTWGAIYSFLDLIGNVFYYDGTPPKDSISREIILCDEADDESYVELYTYRCNNKTWDTYFRRIT